MGFSNNLVGIWNVITMVLSIPIIGVGIWLASKHNTVCIRFLQWPVIILGVVILLISIMGFVGSCWRVSCLLWVYLAVMFLLILLLIVFTVFAFVVTNKGAGEAVSGKGFKEYKLGDYSNWLQRQVNKSSNWNKIQSCLHDSNLCKNLAKDYKTEADFDKANLSPTESGCCKPPTACDYTYGNATYWTDATNLSASSDCTKWSNDESVLCYECDSCKAGLLQNVKKEWKKVAIVLCVMLVLFIAVYTIGCCAFRNARRNGAYSSYDKRGYA